MANDTSMDKVAVIESDVKDTETHTHHASENNNVHDVDTLLSCINIWKKNSEQCNKPTSKDVLNQDRISIKLNNDLQRINNVAEGLLSLTKLKAEIPKNVVVAKSDTKKQKMDISTLISKEDFPMELSDDEDLPEHLRKNRTGDMTLDTRFATESSDENNGEFNFQIDLNKDPYFRALQMIDSQGNSVGSTPPNSADELWVCLKNGIDDIKLMQLKSTDNEIPDPEESLEVDESIPFDKLGQFVQAKEDFETTVENSGTNVETDRPIAVIDTTSTSKSKNSRNKCPRGRRRNYKGKLDGDDNPLLSLGSIECPIITENGILRQGKSKNLKKQASIPSQTKVNGKPSRTGKNVTRNPLADEVVYSRDMEPEKIRGVCYCKSDNSWTAWWTEKGKSRKKAFKLSLYGYEGARKMAIEHRLRMEELLPELKEKKAKMNKKKASEALVPKNNRKSTGTGSRNITRPRFNTPAATVPSTEDGIYKGTRNKTKENKDKEGVFFKENTWQNQLNAILDSNLLNPNVNNEFPFSDARQNVTDTHSDNQNTIVNINHNANFAPTNCKRPNGGRNNMGDANYLQYKRRRCNSYHPSKARIDEIEYFRNLERNLEEEMERCNMDSNQGIPLQTAIQTNAQDSATLNILSHTIEPPAAENDTTQNTEPPKECKVSSLLCRIKLEKSTLEEFQAAIRKALENLQNKETANEQDKDNEGNVITLTQQDTQNPQSPSAEKNYVNVDALCISHNGADNQPLINIIPTYVDGSHGKKVLAFVVLNS